MGHHLKPGTGKPTLAERSARMQTEAVRTPAYPARHVWLTTDAGAELPALLVEQRRTGDGWEVRVIYVTEVRTGRYGVLDEWVEPGRVRAGD